MISYYKYINHYFFGTCEMTLSLHNVNTEYTVEYPDIVENTLNAYNNMLLNISNILKKYSIKTINIKNQTMDYNPISISFNYEIIPNLLRGI